MLIAIRTNKSYNRYRYNEAEPIRTIHQQAQYDAQYPGDMTLKIPPNTKIDCSMEISIKDCGIKSGTVIVASEAD